MVSMHITRAWVVALTQQPSQHPQAVPKPARLEVPTTPTAAASAGGENDEEEDLCAEASWSPSRWDKHRLVQTPPSRHQTVTSPVSVLAVCRHMERSLCCTLALIAAAGAP
jgi:hypothetical protein